MLATAPLTDYNMHAHADKTLQMSPLEIFNICSFFLGLRKVKPMKVTKQLFDSVDQILDSNMFSL